MARMPLGDNFRESVNCMNSTMNPGYDWENSDNQACIEEVKAYDSAFVAGDEEYLKAAERKALKGAEGYAIGVNVESPWGENKVLSVEHENGQDVVVKEIKVKPGFMLSLQRHRGRLEKWEVKSGTLTVISDGERYEVLAGQSIELPKGNVHCMNNIGDEPVTVIETQIGFCREADNVRLVDFNGRPTFPLATLTEMKSAKLYAQIHAEIEEKFGCDVKPATQFVTPEYQNVIDDLRV